MSLDFDAMFGSPDPPPTMDDAFAFVMPYGKYKGRTLEDISCDDEGLKYLDWLHGEKASGNVNRYLDVFMADEGVQRDLGELYEGTD